MTGAPATVTVTNTLDCIKPPLMGLKTS